ncbi:hypothetical protein PUN28_000184 [Cardiocondyla obscurior]|uniref:Uncharacterized protein n=1 Tax=Cardiocondyla obscurior TaxID=286306 RepID=A0AAW2GYL9_9HYME
MTSRRVFFRSRKRRRNGSRRWRFHSHLGYPRSRFRDRGPTLHFENFDALLTTVLRLPVRIIVPRSRSRRTELDDPPRPREPPAAHNPIRQTRTASAMILTASWWSSRFASCLSSSVRDFKVDLSR